MPLPTDPQPGTPFTIEEYKNLRILWKKLAITKLSTNRDHLLYSILSGKDLFRVFTPYRNPRKLIHLAPYETLIRQVQLLKSHFEYDLSKGQTSEMKFHRWNQSVESIQSSPTSHQFVVDRCEATLQSLRHQADKTIRLLTHGR